jgi:hypothetical protein
MNILLEEQSVRTGNGHWGDPSFPKAGWYCVGEDDLGRDENNWATCEMCQSKSIRHVHYLRHRDMEQGLACGCVCAGHLEGDPEAPKKREREWSRRVRQIERNARLEQGRLRRQQLEEDRRCLAWINTGWRPSSSKPGNIWKKTEAGIVTIYKNGSGYKARLNDLFVPEQREYVYTEQVEAMEAAFRKFISSSSSVSDTNSREEQHGHNHG